MLRTNRIFNNLVLFFNVKLQHLTGKHEKDESLEFRSRKNI